MDNHQKFNMDQIIPLFIKLKTGQEIIGGIISYMGDLEDFLNNMNDQFDEKTKDDINNILFFIFNQIKIIIHKQHHTQKINSQKLTIFEQIHEGITYKYKLNNSIFCENPCQMRVGNIIILEENSIIQINHSTFSFFYSDDENINKKNINLIIINIQSFILQLDIILLRLKTYINIIENDVKYFSLFDEKYLYI